MDGLQLSSSSSSSPSACSWIRTWWWSCSTIRQSPLEETPDSTDSTHHFCFLGLGVIEPGCPSSVLSGDHRQRRHHLSISRRDTHRTHPPRLPKPAFRSHAVRVIPDLPLTSNTSDSRSPRSSRIMAPVSASRYFSPTITAFLTGAPFPLRMFRPSRLATSSAWCGSFSHRVKSKAGKESSR